MTKQKSIKSNMLMSIILTASNFVFPLITYSYVARVLSTDGTGKVAFVNSIIQYFSYIAILGIPAYGLRECAKVRDDKERLSRTVQELLLINLISTCVACVAMWIVVLSVSKLFSYRKLFLVMSLNIPLSTIGLEWLYNALEEYRYITLRSLICKVISVILTFLLIRSADDYIWYGFITVFTTSASYVCNFVHVRKFISLKRHTPLDLKRHLQSIFTLFAASAAITIYANFDVSMIGFIRSDHEVGLYNAALKIKNIILSISTAVTSVLIPRIAYYLQGKNVAETKKLVTNSLRFSMLSALPVALYVFIFAKNAIRLVCGEEFVGAVDTLRVLMLCVVPLILTNLYGNQLLVPMGLEKRLTQSVFIGMWINIFLNLLMIPKWGAYGAAYGTLVTEWWNVFWMSRGAKEYRMVLSREIHYFMYIIPLLAGAGISLLIGHFVVQFNVLLQLITTALGFFFTYYGCLLLIREPLLTRQAVACGRKIRKYMSR